MQEQKMSVVADTGYTPLCNEIPAESFPKIEVNKQGSVRINGSMENIEFLTRQYGIKCRFNLITREDEIHIPGARFTKDNEANCALNTVINLCINNNVPKTDAQGHLKAIADRNAYDPITEWIDSVPWNGKDHFGEMVKMTEVPEDYESLRDMYFKKWFMCAVGMLENGRNNLVLDYEGILVFQGEQGLGKTKWFKGLVPEKLHHLIRDGVELNLDNKDSRISFASHWMIELGELDSTFKKSEIGALKAFTTMSSDKVRRPYDRVDTTLFRRTVMFASVNEQQFLQDESGSRRFWCLPVNKLALPDDFDAQQFWAQVKVMLNEAGGAKSKPWFVTGNDAKLRTEANKMFTSVNPVEELMLSIFNTNDQVDYYASATAISLMMGEKTDKATVNNVSKYAKTYFGEPVRRNGQRCFMVPKPRQSNLAQCTANGLFKI